MNAREQNEPPEFRLLIIEDDEIDRIACQRVLSNHPSWRFIFEEAELGHDGLKLIAAHRPAFVLLDYRLPDINGIEILERITEEKLDTLVILLTGCQELDVAVKAMKLGACDYLVKDSSRHYLHLLPHSLERAISDRNFRIEKQHAEEELKAAYAGLEKRVSERTAELVRANEALFDERERALITLRSIADAVIVTDVHGRITQLNGAGEKLIGMQSADVLGKPLPGILPLICEATHLPVDSAFWKAVLENDVTIPAEPGILLNANGNEAIITISAAPIHDRRGTITGSVVVLHDMTKERARTRMLAHQATHDSLTDLPNRTLFLDLLSHYLAHAQRHEEKLAVVFLDLDGFKAVNDNFGHSAGDSLLKSVAQRLKRCVRKDDSLARLAGDEFTLILAGPDIERGADNVAAKVIGELCTPFDIEGKEIRIGTSIGISVYPDDGDDADLLVQKADMAMYRAKANGGKGYRYFSKMPQ